MTQTTRPKAEQKARLTKIVFGLNGVLFLLGGITLLEEAKVVLALIQLIAAITNLAMLPRFIPEARKVYLSIIVLIMNVVVNASIFYDYLMAGKQYIQYVWLLAALLSVVALVVIVRRGRHGRLPEKE